MNKVTVSRRTAEQLEDREPSLKLCHLSVQIRRSLKEKELLKECRLGKTGEKEKWEKRKMKKRD